MYSSRLSYGGAKNSNSPKNSSHFYRRKTPQSHKKIKPSQMKTSDSKSELSLFKVKVNVIGNIQSYTIVASDAEDAKRIAGNNIHILSADPYNINGTEAVVGNVENFYKKKKRE